MTINCKLNILQSQIQNILNYTGPCSQWGKFFNWRCMCLSVTLLIVYLGINIMLLYKIRCNQMHSHYGSLHGPYVPVRVTRGALGAHRHTYAPPRCRTSQYLRTFIPMSVSPFNNIGDPVFDRVGLAGFKSRANRPLATRSVSVSYRFPRSFFHYTG